MLPATALPEKTPLAKTRTANSQEATRRIVQEINVLPDNLLTRKPVFKAVLGGPSDTTFWRLQKKGVIPPPDSKLGRIPLWKVGSIRRVLQALNGAMETSHE